VNVYTHTHTRSHSRTHAIQYKIRTNQIQHKRPEIIIFIREVFLALTSVECIPNQNSDDRHSSQHGEARWWTLRDLEARRDAAPYVPTTTKITTDKP